MAPNELQQILLQWLPTPSPCSSTSASPQSHRRRAGRGEPGLAPQHLQLPSPHHKSRQNSTDRAWRLAKENCRSASLKPSMEHERRRKPKYIGQRVPGLAFGDLAPRNEFEVKHCVFSSDFEQQRIFKAP